MRLGKWTRSAIYLNCGINLAPALLVLSRETPHPANMVMSGLALLLLPGAMLIDRKEQKG